MKTTKKMKRLRRETDTIKRKNRMRILELRNKIYEVKFSLDGLNGRMEVTEKRVSKGR